MSAGGVVVNAADGAVGGAVDGAVVVNAAGGATGPDRETVRRVRHELARRGVVTPTTADIARAVEALDDRGREPAGAATLDLVRGLRREFSGLGDLAVLLEDPAVTDVAVNGAGPVWVDRGHGMVRTTLTVPGPEQARELAVRLTAACGVRLDDALPWADGVLRTLPPGVHAAAVRVHAVLSPPADGGACVSLRVLAPAGRTLADLGAAGMFPPEVGDALDAAVTAGRSILVSGGTGAGKTTLLTALLARVPGHERLIQVEDTRELHPDHPHVVSLTTRTGTADGAGEVTVRDLVRQCLRMRPDRIIVGEIRGAEIADLLLALNTGHRGSGATVHANSVAAVPARLGALGALAGMPPAALAAQAAHGIDLVVHVERGRHGRRVTHLGTVHDRDGLVVDAVWDGRPGPGWGSWLERVRDDAAGRSGGGGGVGSGGRDSSGGGSVGTSGDGESRGDAGRWRP